MNMTNTRPTPWVAMGTVVMWALGVWNPAAAQLTSPERAAATLNPAPARITDPDIRADYATYERQQAAIKALNDDGRHRLGRYSLAKAQCWLDVSFHEYSRNDRSAFPQAALAESHRITQYLARGGDAAAEDNPSRLTPLVNGAERLRPDLWDLAAQLKDHAGYRCAEQLVACAEVELVHAGNEHRQQQWRHAKPYVQIAEDQLAEAVQAVQACVPPAPLAARSAAPLATPSPRPLAATALAPPPAVAAAPPAPPRPVQRQATLLFNFDKRDMPNVRPLSKDQLDRLMTEIRSGAFKLDHISLTGHADISNNSSDPRYNEQLATDRANSVHAYLMSQGISAHYISSTARSDSEQVVNCTPGQQSRVAFEECQLPNRRVEVLVVGTANPR